MPYWYRKKVCRIQRQGFEITIFDEDLTRILTKYDVTWSRKDQFCRDQYLTEQPEEFPTVPVKTRLFCLPESEPPSAFRKFNFEEDLCDE